MLPMAGSRGGIPRCETLASLRSADRGAAPPPGRLAEVGVPIPLGRRGAPSRRAEQRRGPTPVKRARQWNADLRSASPAAGGRNSHFPPPSQDAHPGDSAIHPRRSQSSTRSAISARGGVRHAKRSPSCARRTGVPRPHREDWRRSALQFRWVEGAPWRAGGRNSPPTAAATAHCRPREKQMAVNLRFAARDFGGKCERGLPPFTISNNRIGTRRRAPKVHKGVVIPEPGAAGSQVPRPQPLLLRGLRAASPHFGSPARSAGRSLDGTQSNQH